MINYLSILDIKLDIKARDYRKIVLGEPLVGCMVCAEIANMNSREVLLLDCNNGSVCRVHSGCVDYLFDEVFYMSKMLFVYATCFMSEIFPKSDF